MPETARLWGLLGNLGGEPTSMEALTRVGRVLIQWLDRFGLMAPHRVKPTAELAWPRVVTGIARRSKLTADIIMVGWVLGPAGIAGLAFAYAYWQIGNQLSLGLSGGTISLVSQNYGGGAADRADLAIKMSVWIAIILAIPMSVVFYVFAEPLIRLLGAAPATVTHGTIYLQIVAIAVVFEYFNKIGSRAFAGIGDTMTPMVIRGGGAILNIVLNVIFILGMGLGAAGAALGTVIATIAISVGLAWGFLGGHYPVGATPPVRFRLSGPQWETGLGRQLVAISWPLIMRRLATSLVVFPLLAIAAVFGTAVVAALEVGRQVRGLMNALNWGFSIASSSLVGRELGQGNETEAAGYGWDIIKVSFVAYLLLASTVILLAEPIARVFLDEPEALGLATVFVAVGAVSAIGYGIDGAANGALRGGGDTRWPFYGRLLGLYVFAVPIAYLGVLTPLGTAGLLLALLLETFVPAAVNFYRYRSDEWKAISRGFRPSGTK